MLELMGAGWPAGREPPVAGVDIRVERGAAVGLLNLNQAQAAGLLRVLTGRQDLASGQARLGGTKLREAARRRGVVEVVAAGGVKESSRSVRRELQSAAQAAGEGGERGLLEAMGLAEAADWPVKRLDAGGRVRLALACAAVRRPKLIVLDGATRGLHPDAARSAFAGLLHAIDARDCVAACVNEPALADMCASVVVFDGGHVVQAGEAQEVMRRPLNLAVALAISAPPLNTLRMTMDKGVGRLADGSRFTPPPGLDLPEEGGCTLAFRPDDMLRERGEASALRFAAREIAAEAGGYARLDFGGERWLAPSPAEPRPGRVVNAFVPRDRLMLFDGEGRAL